MRKRCGSHNEFREDYLPRNEEEIAFKGIINPEGDDCAYELRNHTDGLDDKQPPDGDECQRLPPLPRQSCQSSSRGSSAAPRIATRPPTLDMNIKSDVPILQLAAQEVESDGTR